ncbi:MAG: hypothetical protein ACAH88_00345 [Roseimicrobium sp.]
MKPTPSSDNRYGGGRPPKFDEPSRPITITLPESTLRGLERIDADRGRAIVRLTQDALREQAPEQPLVEILEMAPNTGLIVVGPSMTLQRIPFLHLVEVSPTRFLIALDAGNDYRALELAVRDILEEVPAAEVRERTLLHELLEMTKKLRQSERVSMAEILLVKLDRKRKR